MGNAPFEGFPSPQYSRKSRLARVSARSMASCHGKAITSPPIHQRCFNCFQEEYFVFSWKLGRSVPYSFALFQVRARRLPADPAEARLFGDVHGIASSLRRLWRLSSNGPSELRIAVKETRTGAARDCPGVRIRWPKRSIGMHEKTRLAFFVIETQAGWVVRADGFIYPMCGSFADAVVRATREAQAAGLLGFASVVLTRPTLDRPYEIQWTYGRDACPPTAREEFRHAVPHRRSDARH
ncbi:hypothetical protein [Azospirillum brasilense]|uniref:hypothetical protein n=1 Tax=Azospirillum brasilense TaxID=192 RepID=UPI0010C0436D|nr:hypothetical protein [Azospirillum brasilense]